MATATARLVPSLPLAIEEIDAGWITSALRAGGHDAVATSFRLVDIIQGTSTKLRLAIDYDAAGRALGLPPTMILKGGFESHSPGMSDMYRQEARFYSEVAAHVPLNTPRIFYAGADPESWQALILMEDLVARNVTFCRAQTPLGYDHIQRRLRMLAGFHARTWNAPDIMPGGRWDWLPSRFSGFALGYIDHYLQPDIWQAYIDSPRGAAISVSLHDRDQMRRALLRLGEIEAREPVCMLHGDTHPGNLFVDADGTPGFFDTIATRGCWWLEVAYHIVAACDIADRSRWESALLADYLDALAGQGVTPPDFDTAWLRYRQSIAYGLFIFLINETKFQTEATNTAYTARYGIAAIDHDTMRLLEPVEGART